MGLPGGSEYRLAGRADRHTGTANRSQNQSSLHLRRSCHSERCSIVSLPISATVESLNVAVATGILLYQLRT